MRPVAAQEQACRAAPALVPGRTVKGTTDGQDDKWGTSCAGREEIQASPDRLYTLALARKTRVRLLLTTPTWDGVLALRKDCGESVDLRATRASEVACNNDFQDTHHAKIEATLDAGQYYVLVDGHASNNEGAFTLEYETLD